MKKKMSSRPVFIIIVIALASVFLVSNGFAYTIADYYPLAQGFTWTYQEMQNGFTEEYTVTNSGFEDVNGVTTTKQVRNDGTYDCLLFDSVALKIYKEVIPGFGYMMYDPPHGYFPAEGDDGWSDIYLSGWTLYDPGDVPIDGGQITSSLTLGYAGDISVPAGNFSGCLAFDYQRQIDYDSGGWDIILGQVFLAPGVGIVGDYYQYQEFDEQGGLIDEWGGAQILLSYNPFGGGGDGDGNGGLCFITTAAYGSRMAKEVKVFEKVRDEYLLTNELGRAFVSAYYEYSPPLADWIARHPTMKKIVRIGLYPILGLSKWFVGEKPSN